MTDRGPLQRRIMRARMLELAEHRLERLTLKLEQMTKGMRIAARALDRFIHAMGEGVKMCDEDLCPDCNGEGEHVVCCDDICVGQGRCLHGAGGMAICDTCNGEGVVRSERGDE